MLELVLSSYCVFCIQLSLSHIFSRCLPALGPLGISPVPPISFISLPSSLTLIHYGHGKKNILYTAWHHEWLFFHFLMEKELTVISTGAVHGTSADKSLPGVLAREHL